MQPEKDAEMEMTNKPCVLTKCINNVEGICRPDLKYSKWCENLNHYEAQDTVMTEEGLFFKKAEN